MSAISRLWASWVDISCRIDLSTGRINVSFLTSSLSLLSLRNVFCDKSVGRSSPWTGGRGKALGGKIWKIIGNQVHNINTRPSASNNDMLLSNVPKELNILVSKLARRKLHRFQAGPCGKLISLLQLLHCDPKRAQLLTDILHPPMPHGLPGPPRTSLLDLHPLPNLAAPDKTKKYKI